MSPDPSEASGALDRAVAVYERVGRSVFGAWFDVVTQFVRFALIGAAGAVVNMGVLYAFTEWLGLYYLASAAFAIEAALLFVFFLNNEFTFEDPKRGLRELADGIVRSNVIRAGGTGVHLLVLYVLTSHLGVFYLVSNVGAMGAASVFNYLGEKKLNWRESLAPPGTGSG